jgi:signal transduction histidine kinase
MSKITKKLIRYFITIIIPLMLIIVVGSGILMSKLFEKVEIDKLKKTSEYIYSTISVESNSSTNIMLEDSNVKAIMIRDSKVLPITRGNMNIHRNIDLSNLKEKGTLFSKTGEDYLYYKLSTSIGDIVTFKSKIDYTNFLISIIKIQSIIFTLGAIIVIPLISLIGKKFTIPIIKIQEKALEIAENKFEGGLNIETDDEIEDLSKSIIYMASELKQKDSLQREFIANVSHDFKTPLSVIRGYSEAIKDGILSQEEVHQYSNEVIEEVDKLNKMVIDIINLSKLQDKAVNSNKSYKSLSGIVDTIVERMSFVAEKKYIHLEVKFQIEDRLILCDEQQISRVMYNFIDNAVKFSEEFSRILIEVINNEDGIKVAVIDNGIGINESDMKDIWNRYYKHKKSGGMGLGLAICKEILEQHNFKYGVTSKIGEGSEFFFLIPFS